MRALGIRKLLLRKELCHPARRRAAPNPLRLGEGRCSLSIGISVHIQSERLFVFLRNLRFARIAAEAAKGKAWRHIRKAALASVIRQIARALGIRLTKAKLAQAVPIVGAAMGGGFNAYYTARGRDGAYNPYRERFLAAKYRPGVIDVTAERVEGEGFEPRYYPEALEEIPSHLP